MEGVLVGLRDREAFLGVCTNTEDVSRNPRLNPSVSGEDIRAYLDSDDGWTFVNSLLPNVWDESGIFELNKQLPSWGVSDIIRVSEDGGDAQVDCLCFTARSQPIRQIVIGRGVELEEAGPQGYVRSLGFPMYENLDDTGGEMSNALLGGGSVLVKDRKVPWSSEEDSVKTDWIVIPIPPKSKEESFRLTQLRYIVQQSIEITETTLAQP